MLNDNKIVLLKCLLEEYEIEECYKILETIEALKINYGDYLITEPINCDEELKRVEFADYELCSALFTMLLREDHFCNGMFAQRQAEGQIQKIILRMIELLENQG